MIPHDDDVDFALWHAGGSPETAAEFLAETKLRIEAWLEAYEASEASEAYPDAVLEGYAKPQVRLVCGYAKKLEIYWPEFGAYPFRDTDYHNVCLDLTLYVPYPGREATHAQQQHILSAHCAVPRASFEQLAEIVYEGERYRCPADIESFLLPIYGYLGPDAVYNPEIGLYQPRTLEIG